MDKIQTDHGELTRFIQRAQTALALNSEELGKKIGIAGRTLRDWKREKFLPQRDAIASLGRLAKIPLPRHKIVPQYTHTARAGRLGGLKAHQLYGPPGTIEDKRKGGLNSWKKRRSDIRLLTKYTNTFREPEESEDLAEFFGTVLGDGSLSRYQCRIYLSSETNNTYALYIMQLIRKLFSHTAVLKTSTREKMLLITIFGVHCIQFLKRKGLHIGNKVKQQATVPSWITSRRDFVRGCLRGLMDTDGCFAVHRYSVNGKKYSYPKIVFSNRSLPLLDFFYENLKQLGYHPKKSSHHQVWLHNQNEVSRYMHEIGTRNCERPQFLGLLREVA